MTKAAEVYAIAAMLIRQEIAKVVADAQNCGWHPLTETEAWHRAFGEVAGMYRVLQFFDPAPHDCDPYNLFK